MPRRKVGYPAKVVILAGLDAFLAGIGFILAYAFRHHVSLFGLFSTKYMGHFEPYYHLLIMLPFITWLSFQGSGLYTERTISLRVDDLFSILKSITLSATILIVITFLYRGIYLFREFSYSRLAIVYFWIFTIILIKGYRYIVRKIQELLRRRGIGMRRAVIVGTGDMGERLLEKARENSNLGYEIVGFVNGALTEREMPGLGAKVLGPLKDISRIVGERKIDVVMVALPGISPEKIEKILSSCNRLDAEVEMVPSLHEILTSQTTFEELGGIPLFRLKQRLIRGWNRVVKDLEDFIFSMIGMIILSPLFTVLGILIKIDSPGPIFFKQERVGRNGRLFTMFKFRSMKVGAEEVQEDLAEMSETKGPIFKIKHDPRVTRVGKFLRKTSLDELPQLINVCRGEMSLVGPRPPISSEVEKYEEWEKERLNILPGMTGLWQVYGRDKLSFEEMVKWDIYYIRNWSLWLDLKILLRTVPIVLLGKGAY